MNKRLLLFFMALLPFVASAYDAKINGIYYNFSGDEAEVTYENYLSASYSGIVEIPKSVTYNGKTYRVTSIGDYAFYGCTELTTAVIHFGDSLVYNDNLIVNGDFSSGYEGFTTDYLYIDETGDQALCGEGKCAVGTSPSNYFYTPFVDHGDHTSGTGNMLIANGSPDNTDYIWKQRVFVEEGITYEFSAWLMNVDIYSIGVYSRFSNEFIEYSINGTAILGTYDKTENDWERFYGRYTATESGEIEIKIRSVSEIREGNDFAIDDISFSVISAYADVNTSIGNYAFANCPKLRQVFCYSRLVPTTHDATFDGSNIKNVTLYVPAGSVNLYEVLSPWNKFGKIKAIDDNTKYIGTAQELAAFANYVNVVANDVNAVLIADIDFTAYPDVMIGSENNAYQGNFDGAGHTIALALQRSTNWAGLFCNLSGNVHDLTTFGNITTSAKFAGGIAARTKNAIIERCQSKVNIISSIDGDGTHGGIVGVSYEGTIIRDCLVSGSIFGSQTNCCAGVSGWAEGTADGNTNISNCLIISLFTVDTYDSDLLARNSPKVISSNNYFHGDWNAPNNCGNVTVLSREQVKSGEACVLLNAGRTGDDAVWFQTVGEDNHPVLDNTHRMVVYDALYGYHNPDYIINDEMTSFNVATKGIGGTVTFTHDFSGEWESLYLPIAIDYDVIRDNFELAEIDGVVQNDDNGDGIADITVLSIMGFKGQATEPNTPYLIRAKNAGEQTITFEDITVYPTEEATFDCSSFSKKYEFTGSYNTLNATELMNRYTIQGGELVKGATSLAPCRWYMTATARNGASLNLPNKIRVMMVEDVIDGVSPLLNSSEEVEQVYNLAGQRIVNRQSLRGVNIIRYPNGITKKVLLK